MAANTVLIQQYRARLRGGVALVGCNIVHALQQVHVASDLHVVGAAVGREGDVGRRAVAVRAHVAILSVAAHKDLGCSAPAVTEV